jgi:5-formyltetrahydrofolate cyclo-ligase
MIIDQKKALRLEMRAKKKQLPDTERLNKSALIFKQLEPLESFKNARVILLYWSMDDEVHTHAFIEKWSKHKTILLPVVDGEHLRLKQFLGKDNMQAGELMAIPEPTGPDFDKPTSIDLIIVPGVAFDKQKYRMGRGRGFYDRLLAQTKALKIGICFNFQLVDSIPKEAHDIPMDAVIYA